jgi:hypothetical protein
MSEREYTRKLNHIVDDIFAEWGDTQVALAEAAGLGAQTISNLVHRVTKRPQLRTVWRLAAAVGMEVHVTKLRIARRSA